MSGMDLSQFISAFFDEARQRLSSINEGLVSFESGTLDEEGLIRLRRDAHTIKGSALMLGVNDVGETGHLFEDVMEYLIKHPEHRASSIIQFLFDIHDRLAERLQAEDTQHLDAGHLRREYEALVATVEEGESISSEQVGISAEKDMVPARGEDTETAVPEAVSSNSPGTEIERKRDFAVSTTSLDLSQFISAFFDEARQRLSSINEGLVSFESGTLDEEGLVRLRRDAHTIKGSALMLSVNDVGETGHLFEDAMEYLIQHPERRVSSVIQFLFDIHDRLAERLQAEDTQHLDADHLRREYEALLVAVEEGESLPPEQAEAVPVEGMDLVQEDQITAATAGTEESTGVGTTPVLEKRGSGGVTETRVDEEANPYRPNLAGARARVAHAHGSGRFLRVDAERLNVLSGQVIELSTGKATGGRLSKDAQVLSKQVQQAQRIVGKLKEQFHEHGVSKESDMLDSLDDLLAGLFRDSKRLASNMVHDVERQAIMLDDLRDHVLRLMLRPLDSVFSTFPRAVRDIVNRYGKKVRLVTAGESVECDQSMVDSLMEPLVHLINNAIVHGIEPAEERIRAGKPEVGQLTLVATQSGSEIHIEVVDDGRGIDPEHVKKVAVEKGVTTQLEADNMDDAEALEMIFRPGFSTRASVDETAGRGIGMNIVQDTLRRLTGVIRIQTEKGKGTRFLISLPVSIAVQRALLFRIGSQKLAMLTHMVEQVVHPRTGEIEESGGKRFIVYQKQTIPLVDLRRILINGDGQPVVEQPMIVIARHIEGFTGIVVDELYGDAEVIVRELDPYLKRYQAQGLMGNTITDDGSVVLLIEPYGIKEMGRTAPAQDIETVLAQAPEMGHIRALLVEDSIIARQVEKMLLESMGVNVDTAIDGLDAIEKMERRNYDVLITDLEMPRLDGFGLVRRVRNEQRFEDMPILIISTRESAEDRLKGLEAGADAYLVKQSLDQGRLHDTLRALLGPLTGASESSKTPPSQDAPIV